MIGVNHEVNNSVGNVYIVALNFCFFVKLLVWYIFVIQIRSAARVSIVFRHLGVYENEVSNVISFSSGLVVMGTFLIIVVA